jgi:hypothetical protein
VAVELQGRPVQEALYIRAVQELPVKEPVAVLGQILVAVMGTGLEVGAVVLALWAEMPQAVLGVLAVLALVLLSLEV